MERKSKASIILNSIFWFCITLFVVADLYFRNDTIAHSAKFYLLNYLVMGLFNISLYFINYLFLLVEFLKKKRKYLLYLLFFFLFLIGSTFLKSAIAVLCPDELLVYTQKNQLKSMPVNQYALICLFTSGFFLVSSCIIRLIADWFSVQRTQMRLESEKKDMELQFLKSQLNPHFLFNSLNNIYSLAYQKSEKTADAVLKLSEIMRYMIYESNDSWVDLSKEVEYVQSFVELQKLRFKEDAAVNISLHGTIDGQKIVPLILISFVENAFKHGVANDPSDPIRISISANQKILHFSITNKKSKANKDALGGVGLNNVERRLQLLYQDRYKLNVVNSPTHYTTELMLDL